MTKNKIEKVVAIAIFSALVIVLQYISSFINFGGFPITLTLVPIIVAGAVYGVVTGALVGLVFGIFVTCMVITGIDVNGAYMLSVHPVVTISACLLKGVLCGGVSAYIYKKVNNKKLGIYLSSILAPIINTGTLFIFMIIYFDETFATMIAYFMSLNFLIELVVNVLLSPGIYRIIISKRKSH